MNEDKQLLDNIVDAIKEKKGSGIVVVDMQKIDTGVCRYFVICQGGSPAQTTAIARNVGDRLREKSATKPFFVAGLDNAVWIAMDYGNVFVHIFLPRERAFYDLEHLWADATLTEIPDED